MSQSKNKFLNRGSGDDCGAYDLVSALWEIIRAIFTDF